MDGTVTPGADVDHQTLPSIDIPTEVCENIIDMLLLSELPHDALTDIETLHSCALVCRDWRVRAQRNLFYRVQVADTTSFHRLSTTLDNAHHLRDYVYEVQLTGYYLHNTTSIFALFPVAFAGKLPNLFRIDVIHIPDPDSESRWFPRTSVSPKAKTLPYIPLHPHFPAFLSAFTGVSLLYLAGTTFRTFGEFARMLHGLPNLEILMCNTIRWIGPGGSHPNADFTTQPEWTASKDTLPPFAPKLRQLVLGDVPEYGARRLISTRGPHLKDLVMTIPQSCDADEQPGDGTAGRGEIDFSSCTGLETLGIHLTNRFSMDAHGTLVSELLASWKPQQRLDPTLWIAPEIECETTRQGFAAVLHGIGTIAEAWLQTLQEAPHAGGPQECQQVKYEIEVQIHEWEAERKWWLGHLENYFPTWSKSGKLQLSIATPEGEYHEWADEEDSEENAPQSDAGGPSLSEAGEVPSSSVSKETSSLPMSTPV